MAAWNWLTPVEFVIFGMPIRFGLYNKAGYFISYTLKNKKLLPFN
jgi:hypothetical protein